MHPTAPASVIGGRRVVIPNDHVDVTDIIRVNFPEHPLEVFEPRRQDEIAIEPPPD